MPIVKPPTAATLPCTTCLDDHKLHYRAWKSKDYVCQSCGTISPKGPPRKVVGAVAVDSADVADTVAGVMTGLIAKGFVDPGWRETVRLGPGVTGAPVDVEFTAGPPAPVFDGSEFEGRASGTIQVRHPDGTPATQEELEALVGDLPTLVPGPEAPPVSSGNGKWVVTGAPLGIEDSVPCETCGGSGECEGSAWDVDVSKLGPTTAFLACYNDAVTVNRVTVSCPACGPIPLQFKTGDRVRVPTARGALPADHVGVISRMEWDRDRGLLPVGDAEHLPECNWFVPIREGSTSGSWCTAREMVHEPESAAPPPGPLSDPVGYVSELVEAQASKGAGYATIPLTVLRALLAEVDP